VTTRTVKSPNAEGHSTFLDSDLSLDFLRVVERAAVACAHTMGQGDRNGSDQAAVEAMRHEMDSVPIDGTIVIGEGERDEAPMLFIGEKVGMAVKDTGDHHYPKVDIAVDPLEGTNLCATGAPNALAVLAASESGGLLHAPDIYMEKLIVGPSSIDVVDLDAPVRFNLRAIAQALGRRIQDLVIIVLDRPRHQQLIEEIRATGARIRLIGDGDLSAAAVRCLGGEIFARLRVDKPEHETRCRAMGITDFKRIYRSRDLAPGKNIIFAATGVTDGALMKGVRFFGDGTRTVSLVMQTHPRRVRFIDSIHVASQSEGSVKIRF
jgi:fructose-1,6-bisphosphatase/sedoheptulose 1,7-bisphosphatase-like protein